jgi:hypothetical protein
MTLQERAQLQLAQKAIEENLFKQKKEFLNSGQYLEASFLEQAELLDEFMESHAMDYEELRQLNTQLSDFLVESYNTEDEDCLNCGS